MRVFGILAAATIASACGGGGTAMKPAFAKGAEVRISDGGQIYDALNTTDCVKWPSPEVKKKAGRDEWKGFNPGTGNEGKVLTTLGHCDHKTQVVLVAIGDYVVPVTSKGVEAKDKPTTAQDEIAGLGAMGGLGYGGLGYGGYDIYGEGDWGVEGGVVGGVVGGYVAGSYYVGDTVEILNAREIFPDARQCFTWPSDDAKTKGGQDQWGSYYPVEGDVGVVLHVTARDKSCGPEDEVLILDIGGYIVPIKANSVAPIY